MLLLLRFNAVKLLFFIVSKLCQSHLLEQSSGL